MFIWNVVRVIEDAYISVWISSARIETRRRAWCACLDFCVMRMLVVALSFFSLCVLLGPARQLPPRCHLLEATCPSTLLHTLFGLGMRRPPARPSLRHPVLAVLWHGGTASPSPSRPDPLRIAAALVPLAHLRHRRQHLQGHLRARRRGATSATMSHTARPARAARSVSTVSAPRTSQRRGLCCRLGSSTRECSKASRRHHPSCRRARLRRRLRRRRGRRIMGV